MLEKPAIEDQQLIDCLRDQYTLNIQQIDFLPLGADQNTAVFRALTGDGLPYFVKLRSDEFDPMSIIVPKLLHDQRMTAIIAPLSTQSQQLWADFGEFKAAVFPFVEGRDGYELPLSDEHWGDLGRALKALHSAEIPTAITDRLQREQYSEHWRERVKAFQRMAQETPFADSVAAELAAFMRNKQAELSHLVQRAADLAAVLQAQSNPFVMCHADIHAWNVLIDAEHHLYIVDWDTLILAPKERDLMFIGSGLFPDDRTPEAQERLFYQGYGHTQVNPVALAYYHYERIVQDIAAYCEQLLLTDEGGEDRQNGLKQLMSQFQPGQVIEMAYRTEQHLPPMYKFERL